MAQGLRRILSVHLRSLFRAIAMARAGISVGSLTHFFFAYALIDGLVGIAGAIRAAESDQHGTSLLAEGLAGVGAGIFTISWAASFVELAYAIAAWLY